MTFEGVRGTQCTAKAKAKGSGERCKRLVLGGGVCRMHGGATKAATAKRLERVAVMQAQRFRGPVVITGAEALTEELHRTVGQVRALGDELGMLDAPEAEAPSKVQRWSAERGHLRQVAETVVRLQVEEQVGRMTEEQTTQMVLLLRDVLAALGIDPSLPEVQAIVRAQILAHAQREVGS